MQAKPDPKPAAPAAKPKPKADRKPAAPKAKSKSKEAPEPLKVSVPQPHRGGPSAAAPSLVWEEWAHLFGVQPSAGLSPIPPLYDISYDETHRQLIARRNWATLDQYRSLYRFGFYDAVAHTALCEALVSIKRAASAAQPPVAQVVRRSLFKPGFVDYGSEAVVAQLSDELLRREAEYNVTAAAKAAVQQRFGVGLNPNEEEEDDDEPPS
eukprot:jgi/Tetstr1/466468/TSEL_000977.t1